MLALTSLLLLCHHRRRTWHNLGQALESKTRTTSFNSSKGWEEGLAVTGFAKRIRKEGKQGNANDQGWSGRSTFGIYVPCHHHALLKQF
jgi:hypothetical protein